MSIYDTLNPPQREAVAQTEGPVLILAGAGSGKTRVLTHRIAYLMDEKGVNPWNILAITFTNKAAQEMRERVDKLVGFGSESIWVSTFHSACVRILQRHIDNLGYDTNFTIYDTDDQKSLMKDVCRKMNIDTKIYKERSLLAQISHAKDELLTPDDMEMKAAGDYNMKKVASVYREYQAALRKNNALDFDDLIVKTVELFEKCGAVLEYYQERFKYIMVDEYQDTNTAQFKFISLLAQRYQNLCVVGDDDQSIYKFRGANIGNILGFEHVFPDARVIRLEQNYRSTRNILNAANQVIANNTERKAKTLWTENEYRILNRKFPVPTERLYSYFYHYKLDVDKMREATSYLIGRHDFASFCGSGAQVKTTIRTVTGIEVFRDGDIVTIRVSGTGFLYNMVRIISGTLIEIGNGQYPPERMQKILDAKDRSAAGPTAPAQGLTLMGIQFFD